MLGRVREYEVMRRSRLPVAVSVFAASILAGCGRGDASSTPPPHASAGALARPAASPAPAAALTRNWSNEVQLVPVDHEQWLRELAAFRGRIVVVDHWATWCVPCLERFPKMLDLAGAWGPKGVTFVSLSLDDRDDPDSIEQASRFLRDHDARIPNYLMDEIIPDAFEKLDLLGIPAVLVYDADGTVRYRLTGDDPNDQFTEADIEEAVRALVGEAAGSADRSEA